MDLEVTSNNPLKLFGKSFMHIEPLGSNPIKEGGKYNAILKEYGQIGQIECLKVWSNEACVLSENVMWMAEGRADFRPWLESKSLMQKSMVQICLFRFIRRHDEPVYKLFKAESVKSGMHFYSQTTMFNS